MGVEMEIDEYDNVPMDIDCKLAFDPLPAAAPMITAKHNFLVARPLSRMHREPCQVGLC